jgi:hypothetical protein
MVTPLQKQCRVKLYVENSGLIKADPKAALKES